MIETKIESYLNFVALFRKLGKYQSENTFKPIVYQELLATIHQTDNVYLKHWLVRKVKVAKGSPKNSLSSFSS